MLSKQTNKRNNNRLEYKKKGCQKTTADMQQQQRDSLTYNMCGPPAKGGWQDNNTLCSLLCVFYFFLGMKKTSLQPQKQRQLLCFHSARFFVLPPFVCGQSCVVLETTTAKLKKDNGHTNTIKPVKSAKGKRTRSRLSMRAKSPQDPAAHYQSKLSPLQTAKRTSSAAGAAAAAGAAVHRR